MVDSFLLQSEKVWDWKGLKPVIVFDGCQDIDSICRVLSAILHLGDIDLAEVESHHRDTLSYIINTELTHIGI